MKLSGRCFCGEVRFYLLGPTDFVSHCHCESCRRSHAAPFVTWTSVPLTRRFFEAGEKLLRSYNSSSEVAWDFCSHCGSSLCYRSTSAPDTVYVAAASLDRLDQACEGHVSFEEHLPWLDLSPEVPRFVGKTSQLWTDSG